VSIETSLVDESMKALVTRVPEMCVFLVLVVLFLRNQRAEALRTSETLLMLSKVIQDNTRATFDLSAALRGAPASRGNPQAS
jgi:hypothetical protein